MWKTPPWKMTTDLENLPYNKGAFNNFVEK